MLTSTATFPQAGSYGYLRPEGDEVRILRRNADGTVLVAFTASRLHPTRHRDASGNRTVPASHVHEKLRDAIRNTKRRRAA